MCAPSRKTRRVIDVTMADRPVERDVTPAPRPRTRPVSPWISEAAIAALSYAAAERNMVLEHLVARILESVAETPKRIALVADRAARS